MKVSGKVSWKLPCFPLLLEVNKYGFTEKEEILIIESTIAHRIKLTVSIWVSFQRILIYLLIRDIELCDILTVYCSKV